MGTGESILHSFVPIPLSSCVMLALQKMILLSMILPSFFTKEFFHRIMKTRTMKSSHPGIFKMILSKK